MRGGRPDRPPVFCQLSLGHYFLNTRIPPHRIWFASESFAEALVALQRRYGFDGILINLPGRPEELLQDIQSVEVSGRGERVCWRDGSTTVFPEDDNPWHETAEGRPLRRADWSALDPDGPLDLGDCSGYWWNTYHVARLPAGVGVPFLLEPPDSFLRTIRSVRAQTRGEVSIHGEVFSPFTHFMELFGYETALLALAEDASRAQAWLERLTASAASWAVAQARAGVDAVLISSAFAGGGFISRDYYARFVLPHERALARAVKSAGAPVYTHTCGRIADRLDLMAETGIDGLDTLDPPPLGNVDLGEAKRTVGRRLFLKGNMNPVALLAATEPEQVAAEARRCLEQAATGGGYILSTACSVAPRLEPWKLEMLVPLAEAFARGR